MAMLENLLRSIVTVDHLNDARKMVILAIKIIRIVESTTSHPATALNVVVSACLAHPDLGETQVATAT